MKKTMRKRTLQVACLLFLMALCLGVLPAGAATDNTWTGSGPFATGQGNRVINALAVSPDGATVYAGTGSGTVLTYLATKPTATTGAATNTAETSATLNGTVNAKNADTTVTFQYGATTAYGQSIAATPSTVTGSADTPVTADLTGLAGGTYHYRVGATNADGTTYGNDKIFHTSYEVSAAAGSNGTLDGSTTSPKSVDYGSTTAFTFDAQTGYHVASVSGCGGTAYNNSSNTVTTYTYTTGSITADCTVTASFAMNQSYKLSVGPSGSGSGSISGNGINCSWDGSATSDTCSGTYDYNTSISLTETPGTCSYFKGWSNACAGNGSECNVTMDQDETAEADFELYSLVQDASPSGGYDTATSGYDAASGGFIYLQANDFGEDLVLDQSVDVTFDSGWNCDFTAYSGNTTINSLTVEQGSLTLQGNALVIGP